MNIIDTLQANKWRELCDYLRIDADSTVAEEISEHIRELRWSQSVSA